MTFREAREELRKAGIESDLQDAALLFEKFCGVPESTLLAFPDREYDSPALRAALQRRAERFPLQYILGEWQFFRQRYEVSPACLIPRQDTEILVEQAIRLLPQGAFFADLCTGSGCIAVSVLAERQDTRAVAVELSEEALELAKRNAVRNGVEKRFTGVRGDVLHADFLTPEKPAAILSNPPYIPTAVVPTLSPEVRSEPNMALDGGADGMLFYRALLQVADRWLPDDGFCLFEIGFDQGEEICRLANSAGFSCRIHKDYGGQDRVVELRRTF